MFLMQSKLPIDYLLGSVVHLTLTVLFTPDYIILNCVLVFPGGKGDCTNHRGPDHEKGHATSFYQVSKCHFA